MRIEWIATCERVEKSPAGETTLQNVGFETVTVAAFPGEAALIIVMAFRCLYQEAGESTAHTLAVSVLRPDMSMIDRPLRLRLTQGQRSPSHPPGFEGHTLQELPLAFDAVEPGTYTVCVSLDDGEPCTLPIIVRLPGGNTAP